MIPLLLVLAGACHVAALLTPFVEMRAGFSGQTYGLIPSVIMLWEHGLPWLALLVIAFSIVFPFAKLGVLWWVWRMTAPTPGRRAALAVVESLGKWSMLDIFLVCLLLGATSDQVLVVTKPLIGVPCFLIGVLTTMSAGAVIARRWHQPHAGDPTHARIRGARWVLLLAAASLLIAQIIPIMGISGLLLRDHDFTIAALTVALFKMQAFGPAVALAITVLVLPWLALFVQARAAAGGRRRLAWQAIADTVQRWAMLDVFAFALVLFLVESREVVPVAPDWGCAALGGAVLLHMGASWWIRRTLERPVA